MHDEGPYTVRWEKSWDGGKAIQVINMDSQLAYNHTYVSCVTI